MAESRVTTVVAEVLSTGGAPNARVTTVVAEVLHTGGVPHARVTGVVAEVLHGLEELTAGGTGRKPIVVVVALLADFDYRLSRKSRADLRQGLRDRCGLTLPPDPPGPPDPVVIPVPTRPDPQPDPTTTPDPTPDPTKPAPRLLETIGEAELKTAERRLKSFEKFEIYAWVEATLTVAFEGTDAERAVLKAQWKNGKFKHEVEVKLNDVLGVDFEGEWDKKPELRLKRDIKISKSLTLTPKTKLNPLEPFELEGSVKTPGFPLTIGSLTFKISGEIKGIAVVRLAWRRLIKRKIKDWLRDQVKDLPDRILKFFGTKLVKDRLRLILIAVAGLMLVKLLFDDDDQPSSDEPVPVPPEPGDVEAFAAVFEVAQRQDAARRRLLAEAHAYRNGFAIAFGDTLSKLAEPDWRKRLAAFTVIKPAWLPEPSQGRYGRRARMADMGGRRAPAAAGFGRSPRRCVHPPVPDQRGRADVGDPGDAHAHRPVREDRQDRDRDRASAGRRRGHGGSGDARPLHDRAGDVRIQRRAGSAADPERRHDVGRNGGGGAGGGARRAQAAAPAGSAGHGRAAAPPLNGRDGSTPPR